MGRPVNKKFFGDPASAGYQIACQAYFTGGGAPEAAYIVSQRSNSVYIVTDDGTTNVESLRLVEGAPAAEGEMQVVVTPILGQELTAAQDETAFSTFTGGTGYDALDTITLSNGDIVTVDAVVGNAVTEFTITTVNGSATAGEVLTQDTTNDTGDGFTLTVEASNLSNTEGTPESARIINQHTVKTFEDNVYSWRAGESSTRPFAVIGS